jgi:hypothetical protein
MDRMKNEEWYQFLTEYKDMAAELMADNVFYLQFIDLYLQVDAVLELIRKSSYTELIAAAEAKRDLAFRSYKGMVKAMQTHVDPVKQKAAANLMLVLDSYGNITTKGYSDKTASINNFNQELKDNYSEDIAKLGLYEWLVRLNDANIEFNTLMMKRNEEQSGKLRLNIDDLRKQINELYREMADYIEANARISKEPGWMVLFNKLNANIIRYRNTLAQRKGIAKAKKGKNTVQAAKVNKQPEA